MSELLPNPEMHGSTGSGSSGSSGGAYLEALIADGVTAVWEFDDPAGSVLTDSQGVANGTYVVHTPPTANLFQQPTLVASGNGSLRQTNDNNTLCLISGTSVLGQGSAGCTLEMVLELQALAAAPYLFQFDPQYELLLGTDGIIEFLVWDADANVYSMSSTGALSLSTKYHIAAVFEVGSPSTLKTYINGALDNTHNIPLGHGLAHTGISGDCALLGFNGATPSNEPDALVQYGAYYNQPLSAGQIAAHAALV